MTPITRLWAAIQTQPKPSRVVRDSWHVAGVRPLMAYDAVLDAAPRPVHVWRTPQHAWLDRRWLAHCRVCQWQSGNDPACLSGSHEVALSAALHHLHHAHGCPSRRITGEACHPTCIHCHGWQWTATDTTERSDW